MALKDILNAKQNKEELDKAKDALSKLGGLDYLELQNRISSAQKELELIMRQHAEAQTAVVKLRNTKADYEREISNLKQQAGIAESIVNLENILQQKRSQIIVADDAILMESFSLYSPRFSFASAEEYRVKLDECREVQKQMIRSGTAATGAKNWQVNGSSSQGAKLVNDMIKLCLRSFNNECDSAIEIVRFNNFDRCLQRIDKSAETIQKTAKMMSVTIADEYIKLKHEELSIALEYQIKKQEEKERLKELRAQQREEARVAKELEQSRLASLKEQKHYQQAYDLITKQIDECSDDEAKKVLYDRRKEISQKLVSIEDELTEIDYRQANQRAGYVYVISNIGAFGEGVYKIGMTRRLEPQERIDELGDASVPFNFDIHAMIFSDDAPALEAALHNAFDAKKVNKVNGRKEFFRVTLDEVKDVVYSAYGKSVEFIDIPAAEQYRQSIRM